MREDGEDNKTEEEKLAAEWESAMEGGEQKNELEAQKDPSSSPVALDQNQIDSLFGSQHGQERTPKTGIKAIIGSPLVTHERLPMLEVIFDRMVREMSTSLRQFTSDNVEVSITKMTSVRFGDFLDEISLPAMIAVFSIEQWEKYGIITADSSLIYSIVDVLLGGRRGGVIARVEGRPYTTIERNLIERLIRVVLNDLRVSFSPISNIDFVFDRLETNPRFAAIERPGNAAILVRVKVEMDERGGSIDFVLPYSTLEPIRNALLQMFMGEKFGRDSIWENHLAFESLMSKVTIEALMDQKIVTLNDILNWKVGSQVVFNARPDSLVLLRCGDRELFKGIMGQKNHNISIKIEEIITEDPDTVAMENALKRQEQKSRNISKSKPKEKKSSALEELEKTLKDETESI